MSVTVYVIFKGDDVLRELHSYPTRRSSDLNCGKRLKEDEKGFVFCLNGGRKCGFVPEHKSLLLAKKRPLVSRDRKSTRLNSSHVEISYAVFCLKKKTYRVSYASN